ncbi:hypothetical protein TREMEDRAFT_65004 [Tremella mesenterica DSM 1558]|uniref:uncharacterized protein n=1 Tax=Tremella mesenterica (strain ATCC 24925 / CBS 8224 / DSM 1558 / NBRC 9311 / NRRL Y-6157 / RJB 2259-6 / UBC 559-6) TaxID=578456 RepID=UPI0003F493D1|nr:uncharacterized protein TREMEDRAFT_65004 [Tremella mesenterica DSM 1558]EIW67135.1 hypothetical protein TREMEDRAFT_65004 [Tremella mesenterica DSM 1558]
MQSDHPSGTPTEWNEVYQSSLSNSRTINQTSLAENPSLGNVKTSISRSPTSGEVTGPRSMFTVTQQGDNIYLGKDRISQYLPTRDKTSEQTRVSLPSVRMTLQLHALYDVEQRQRRTISIRTHVGTDNFGSEHLGFIVPKLSAPQTDPR